MSNKSLLLIVAALAAIAAGFLILGVFVLPDELIHYLDATPVKFVLIVVGLVLISCLATLAYWMASVPTATRAILAVLRGAMLYAAFSAASPLANFGLKTLSVIAPGGVTLGVEWDTPSYLTAANFFVAAMLIAFTMFEYGRLKKYENERGVEQHSI